MNKISSPGPVATAPTVASTTAGAKNNQYSSAYLNDEEEEEGVSFDTDSGHQY
jgi:hypothetical protein